MKFLCAPDSFKESLDAVAVARAMAEGIRAADPAAEVDECPVADGGEGTLDALVAAFGGEIRTARVAGPLGTPLDARFAIAEHPTRGRLGVIELAEASGLARIPPAERDPTRTTTYGTGELIARAAAAGAETIIVGVGGSGTCDGGTGLAQALGVRFFDGTGALINGPMTGGALRTIGRLERPAPERKRGPARRPRIIVACDVRNPLCGEHGAAAIYGPQKGATPAQVRQLDEGLAHLAALVGADAERGAPETPAAPGAATTNPTTPGAGAAGGAGFGLAALCGASLERGIELVLDAVRFSERCADADLVLTGEGRLEANSLEGKAAIGVAMAARALGTPTIAIVGSTGPGAERCLESAGEGGPLRAFVSLSDRYGRGRALTDTARCVAEAAAEVTRS